MKREIKFRMWHLGSMSTPSTLESIMDGYWKFPYKIDTDAIMRYTGIKDEVGKEIYEGDIVDELFGVGVVTYGEFIAEIYYCTGWYVSDKGVQISEAGLTSEYKVIGNIHETPELIK